MPNAALSAFWRHCLKFESVISRIHNQGVTLGVWLSWINKRWDVSALFDRLLGVFWKRSRPPVAPSLLTLERISERLHVRPVRHNPPKAGAFAKPTHVLVTDEAARPPQDDELAIADTLDHGGQRTIEERWPDAEPHVANAADMAAAKQINIPAPTITTEPDATSISAEETTWANEENELPSVEAPSVEKPPIQSASECSPRPRSWRNSTR